MTELVLSAEQLDQLADRLAKRLSARPLAVDVDGACRALGVSWDYWKEHIAPDVAIVRRGRRKLIPVAELERWLNENAIAALPTRARRAA